VSAARAAEVRLGRETGGDAQSKAALKGWPCAGFFSPSKKPGSFPGAPTALSWTGLFCAPAPIQISILPAPGVCLGWGCVPQAVEKSLPPRNCHWWCYLSNNRLKANN